MSGNVKAYIGWAKKERMRWRKRYVKRAAAKKYRAGRFLLLLLAAGTVLFLSAAGHFRELIFFIRQEQSVEYIKAGGEEEEEYGDRDLYRLIFRLRTGEIELYHEKSDAEAEKSADR